MGADGDSIDMKDLVNVLQSKYPGLSKFQPKPMTDLPPKVQARVETLKELQGQHDELEKKFLEEKAALEAKYLKLYEPLYSKRSEIVNGADEGSANDTKMANGEAPTPDEEKGIPEFWLNALKAHPLLAMEITERDEGALKFLKDIKWCRITEAKGFKIEFFFDENPYFKNTVLTKTYHMVDEDEPIMEKSIGTEIEWLPGKCLTQKLLKKKPRKGSKNSKPITKLEDCPSFFNFFKPPEVPEEDDDLDEDATEELQALMEQDYDVGSIIRDKIIPRAVTFFTGEADVEDEYGFDEEDDDDDDDDDDEEEDEVEDDEDDSEDEAPQKKKLGGKAKKPTKVKQEEQPAECKQQ